MISHYVKTGQKATALHRDFAELRGAIASDVATIRTDEVRLVEIYKTLNDVMIPEAEVFARNADKVFDKEMETLINTIYSTPEARELKKQRDEILKEMHALERRINDANISINYYKDHIQSSQETLGSLKENYIEAQVTKPEPPSGIGKFLTLGSAQRKYERDIYEWNKTCSPVIDRYEGLAVDISVDTDEIERRTKAIADDTLKYNELKLKEVDITKRLAAIVTSTPETKRTAAQHLDDIIKLLHLAKKNYRGKARRTLSKHRQSTKTRRNPIARKPHQRCQEFPRHGDQGYEVHRRNRTFHRWQEGFAGVSRRYCNAGQRRIARRHRPLQQHRAIEGYENPAKSRPGGV
jgi:hypothetical protein